MNVYRHKSSSSQVGSIGGRSVASLAGHAPSSISSRASDSTSVRGGGSVVQQENQQSNIEHGHHHHGGPNATNPPEKTGSGSEASTSRKHHHHSGHGSGGRHRSHHRRVKHAIHWFRRGLRLSDNPALLRAIKRSETWRCIFILDPWFAGSSNQGVNKWRFLLQCLEDLDKSLRNLNSRLFVIRGQPADVLPQLFREWGTNYISFEEDPEPYGQVRDKNIVAMCQELGVTVVKESSHTLYNLEKIIETNGGKPPLTYSQFLNNISAMKPPPSPLPALSSRLLGNSVSPVSDDHDDRYGVPTLGELGFDTSNLKQASWIGGETEALTRLLRHLERKAWVASFGRPKMTPQSLLPNQTGLSPYLRFGCLSTRSFYHALGDLYREIRNEEPPLSLFGQLLWREFFYTAATRNPKFDRMDGNPICVQIPWERNPEALAKWASGNTGYPWIDAIMIQLREEGWIHHLAKHATACFLTRGDLWISWEEGMKVFDELLLDADWSVNAGTWMWLSCSSFFQRFFPPYCPVKFGRKADPNGDYIRRYLPVLKNFPTRFIHEPWTAPEQVQKSAKCIIGQDYPLPMVDHESVSKMNHERMKQVYLQLDSYRNAKTPPEVSQQVSSDYQQSSTTNNKQQSAGYQTGNAGGYTENQINLQHHHQQHQQQFQQQHMNLMRQHHQSQRQQHQIQQQHQQHQMLNPNQIKIEGGGHFKSPVAASSGGGGGNSSSSNLQPQIVEVPPVIPQQAPPVGPGGSVVPSSVPVVTSSQFLQLPERQFKRDPVEDVSSGSPGNSADDVDNLVPSIGSLQPQSVMDSIRDEDERRNQGHENGGGNTNA